MDQPKGEPMTYSSAGIYGITIQVWDGDRELPAAEINPRALAAQLHTFADVIREEAPNSNP